jgi:hypothetical protein
MPWESMGVVGTHGSVHNAVPTFAERSYPYVAATILTVFSELFKYKACIFSKIKIPDYLHKAIMC